MKFSITRSEFLTVANAIGNAASNVINTAATVVAVGSAEKARVMKEKASFTQESFEAMWDATPDSKCIAFSHTMAGDKSEATLEIKAEFVAEYIETIGDFYRNLVGPASTLVAFCIQTKVVADGYQTDMIKLINKGSQPVE